MANVYAVKTGNWSDTTVWNTGALPTSADDVYSNNFTVTIDQNVTVLSIRNTSASGISAGGGFAVSGNFTISAGTLVKNSNLITYSGSGTLNISTSIPSASGNGQYLSITGNGNVNWIGYIYSNYQVASILKGGSGKLTITGDLSGLASNAGIVQVNSGDIEITGNLTISNAFTGISGAINCVIYLAGINSQCIVTGTMLNNNTVTNYVSPFQNSPNCIYCGGTNYVKHIGTMQNAGQFMGFCVTNLSVSSINIFTGPFVSNSNGGLPFCVTRMNYQVTLGSYFEFRDSSTNGAIPPAAGAPATRLVSPDTVVDAPVPANVRFGVSYALGTQTGTLRVPSPNSVAFGVLTDNTTGTAVLTPQAVWDYATSSLTTAGSIGARLKNASTVDTTGDQLAALL